MSWWASAKVPMKSVIFVWRVSRFLPPPPDPESCQKTASDAACAGLRSDSGPRGGRFNPLAPTKESLKKTMKMGFFAVRTSRDAGRQNAEKQQKGFSEGFRFLPRVTRIAANTNLAQMS